ncbi:MAG: hypothetical protein A2269_05110, partial [Lentisphaerae bacterium RIFOXYA12_FULL_60_10]
YRIHSAPRELQSGLREITRAYPSVFVRDRKAVALELVRDDRLAPGTVRLLGEGRRITLLYRDRANAFRGLGTLMATPASAIARLNRTETAAFSMRGLMLDCSRNGVIRPDALKDFLRRVALMGVNLVMCYTEDTYEVPGEPFFGYLRGPLTQAELKDLDDYADALGIEMIPCIQTLAHLEQILQWDPYFGLRDTPNILLPEDRTTYDFIAKIIKAASAPFRSKRIHVGMDEAHGLGTGRYAKLHGKQDSFQIMNTHLAKVRDLCKRQGLTPMIWSDMYFRLGSETHDYYDLKWKIPPKAVKHIPRDVQLVYWDYYHDNPDFYRKMIANHRKLGSDPVFAGGIWTWSHKWCALPWSFTAVDASMTACKAEGVREAFMTMWGDDGMEVDIFSSLPGIQYFCEHAFSPTVDRKQVARRFETVCGSDFADWVRASGIDTVPSVKKPSYANTSVGLLWQDPLFAILDPHMRPWDWKQHYLKLEQTLTKAMRGGGLSGRLEYPARIAGVLARKVDLRRRLEQAYRRKDRRALTGIVRSELTDLEQAVKALWRYHRAMWMRTYKPFGWEVIEHRYGGLMARLDTVRQRLGDYLAGRVPRLEELEAPLHDPWTGIKDRTVNIGYSRVKTPSCIK